MLLEDLQVVLKVAEFRSITAVVRLLRNTFREKSTGILNQLIEKGVLDDSVLAWGWENIE
jgi:hypothetical protein